MEIATPTAETTDTNYISVRNQEEGAGSDGSSSGNSSNENNNGNGMSTQVPPLSITELIRVFAVGILIASPMLTFIILGTNASVASICIYIGLLQSTNLFVQCEIKSGVGRWFLGFFLLFSMSSWKSGILLASVEDMRMKAILYALTAFWECSNAVLILGGKDGITDPREAILYSMAPCQVKFVRAHDITARSQYQNVFSEWCTPSGKSARRSFHILLCCVGVWFLIQKLIYNPSLMEFASTYVLLELECMAFLASMSVVLFDIPSHLWQLIYDLLETTPFSPSSSMHTAKCAKVILPYGWVYSSSSTRQFWSRWSRPATQLIRRLFYYPLGGRNRWYISIPIMFLLNASSHFDLSYAIAGERSEVYWLALFGTLAGVAMLEIVGDQLFSQLDSNGNTSFPSWYWWTRAVVTQASLRVVLYIMIHLCFKSSMSEMFGA